MEKRNAALRLTRPPLSPDGEAGVGQTALPRPQSKAPEDLQSNVITFRTPPSQRINDFDPAVSALWPTWVALCGLSRNSLAGTVQSTGKRRRRGGTDEGDSYRG